MGKVDGLIIPRSYNDYYSRSDPTALHDAIKQFTDAALSATSENPVQNKVVKAALDVINAVIPAGASSSDKLALESSVDAIDAKIPTQASAQNQLADKDFVNSSIGTNTANYISDNGNPFTSVAALEAYSGTVTNNDYAFVTGTDSEGNVYYDRYKATVSGASVSWAKEYRLNNSSFTAAQWAAISSGITAAKVAQYDAGVTPANVVESGNMNAITSNAVATKALLKSDFDNIVLLGKKGTTGQLSLNDNLSNYSLVMVGASYETANKRIGIQLLPTLLLRNRASAADCLVASLFYDTQDFISFMYHYVDDTHINISKIGYSVGWAENGYFALWGIK